jgi:hypothetical protein
MRNQLLNILWTIVGFFPVCLFWFTTGTDLAFYAFLLFGVVAGCLPESIYIKLQISEDFIDFEKLGIRSIRKFSQSGNFKKDKSKGLKAYLQKLSMFERYHYICLIFFQCSSVYACLQQHIAIALLIFGTNIIYNVCPILLQQYNRLRIFGILNRYNTGRSSD